MGDAEKHFGFKCDGWKTIKSKWAQWYPGVPAGKVLAQQHQGAWENVYSKAETTIVGALAFMYADEWGHWPNYRVDDDPDYLAAMEAYRPLATVTQPTEPPVVTKPPAVHVGFAYTLQQVADMKAALNAVLKILG